MRLIRWSLEHPYLVIFGYLAVVVLALLSLSFLIPTRLTPAVRSYQLAVVTENLNLAASEVERQVTDPLEKKLARTPGLVTIRSQSMSGASIILLEFAYGSSLDEALPWVRNEVSSASRVLTVDPLNLPVVSYAVDWINVDANFTRQYLEQEVAPRLRALPEIDGVYVVGARSELRLLLDRDQLRREGLSILEVAQGLEGAFPSGQLSQFLAPLGNAPIVSWQPPPDQLETLLQTRIVLEGGKVLPLGQLARAEWGADHDSPAYRFNGRDCLSLNVVQKATASSPITVKKVDKILREISHKQAGLQFEQAYNHAHFVQRFQQQVGGELLLAGLLAGLVLFVFLRDAPGTGIILATIPASLACAVLGFVPLNLSLNSSSLVGLLLALGRVVDDTIIDLHAIARHRSLGKTPAQAALAGCWEVRRAVFSSTTVMVLALLPLTLAGGLTQDMFVSISWPFLLALLASLLVSMTLTPVLASLGYAASGPVAALPLQQLEQSYRNSLRWALSHRGFVLSLAGAACYLGWTLYPMLGSEMMPLADTGQIFVQMEARAGLSRSETLRLASEVEGILRKQPETLKVSSEIGMISDLPFYTGYAMQGHQGANMWVTLKDQDQRQRSLWDISDAVYGQAMGSLSGLRRLSLRELGSDVMASPMAPVEVVIRGPQLERLAWLAEQTRMMGQNTPGLVQVANSWALLPEALQLRPLAEKCADLGLQPDEVARQARFALQGGQLEGLELKGAPVVLSYLHSQRRHWQDLEKTQIHGPQGQRAELGSLVKAHLSSGSDLIEHLDLQRCISVTGNYRKGGPGSMQLSMNLAMSSHSQLPYPKGYSIHQRGDMVQMMDSSRRLWRGLWVALGLILLALVFYFRSLTLAALVLATTPLQLVGVLAALLAAGQTLSSVSLLALVVLQGMTATAAILLLDAVARCPLEAREAILEGASSRIRPILMTVSVTVCVMLPLAFFPATGMDAYSPLATVVIGGLASATLLTLWVVPVLASWPLQSKKDLSHVDGNF